MTTQPYTSHELDELLKWIRTKAKDVPKDRLVPTVMPILARMAVTLTEIATGFMDNAWISPKSYRGTPVKAQLALASSREGMPYDAYRIHVARSRPIVRTFGAYEADITHKGRHWSFTQASTPELALQRAKRTINKSSAEIEREWRNRRRRQWRREA